MKNTSSTKRQFTLLAFILLIIIGIIIVAFVLQGELLPSQPSSAQPEPLVVTPASVPITSTMIAQSTAVFPIANVSPISTPVVSTLAVSTPTIELSTSISVAAAQPISLTPAAIPIYSYQIVNTYPHDPGAFTQGLIYHKDVYKDVLFEGTGLNGRSSLRKVELKSGVVLEKVDLAPEYFGEGITLFADRIIQLSWQNQRGFIWGIDNGFTPIKEYSYPTEGWGITHDGEQLIMSDGSDNLYFWDAVILTGTVTQAHELKHLSVKANGEPIVRLNELEYVEGQIFANIWQTDRIARIDPIDGTVVGWIDLTNLLSVQERANSDVLNGIAYDDTTDRLFVTGKLWPKLFEIKLIAKQ